MLAGMNKLPLEKRVQILTLLVEGASMRAVSRVCGVSINTVTKLQIGRRQGSPSPFTMKRRAMFSLAAIQCDEIWAFCYAKAKNAPAEMKAAGTAGDAWTWTALDPNSKFIVTWRVGGRDAETGGAFMHDLAFRLRDRIQLTTDGFPGYLRAVEKAFGTDVDYAQLVKIYSDAASKSPEKRYSPAECIGAHKDRIIGKPAMHHVSTSHVER